MGSKKIRPVTPGMRGQVATDFKDITKKKPEKSLLQSKKSSGGRNIKDAKLVSVKKLAAIDIISTDDTIFSSNAIKQYVGEEQWNI